MKVMIRGAGDLASGIAYELWLGGHEILMTDVAVPLAVRRAVSWEQGEYFQNMEGYLRAVDTKPIYLEELDPMLAGHPVGVKQRKELTSSLRERIRVIRQNRKRPPKIENYRSGTII